MIAPWSRLRDTVTSRVQQLRGAVDGAAGRVHDLRMEAGRRVETLRRTLAEEPVLDFAAVRDAIRTLVSAEPEDEAPMAPVMEVVAEPVSPARRPVVPRAPNAHRRRRNVVAKA